MIGIARVFAALGILLSSWLHAELLCLSDTDSSWHYLAQKPSRQLSSLLAELKPSAQLQQHFIQLEKISVIADWLVVKGSLGYTGLKQASAALADYQKFTEAQSQRLATLYLVTEQGQVQALDLATGELLFDQQLSLPVNSAESVMLGLELHHQEFYDQQQRWRSVLQISVTGWSTGLAALEITQPAAISWLWSDIQINMTDTQPRLALAQHVLLKVQIQGEQSYLLWAANGHLRVIDPITGEQQLALELDQRSRHFSQPLLVVDRYSGASQWLYLGDDQGQLWRINLPRLIAGLPAAIKVFQAAAGEQIVAAPYLVKHPSKPDYLLLVATENRQSQRSTIYGFLENPSLNQQTVIHANQLALQNIAVSQVDGALTSSVSDVHLAADQNGLGWRLQLPKQQLVVGALQLVDKQLFFKAKQHAADCLEQADTLLYGVLIDGSQVLPDPVFLAPETVGSGLLVISQSTAPIRLQRTAVDQFEVCLENQCFAISSANLTFGRQRWRYIK